MFSLLMVILYSMLFSQKVFLKRHRKWYILTVLNLTCLPPISLDKQFRMHHLPLYSLLEGKYPLILLIPLHLLSERTCLLLSLLVPSQSPASSLILGQSPLNLTQNTGQFTVTQPDDMDNVSSKVDHPTMACMVCWTLDR